MLSLVTHFAKDDSGATAIEYGLIAAFVAVAMITALHFLGGELESTFEIVTAAMEEATE
jgi:pilus assembly protein Flp/PilA